MKDAMRADVCQTVCSLMGNQRPDRWWTPLGPTPEAIRHRDFSPMSTSARALLGIAWTIWAQSDEGPSVGDCVLLFDRPTLRAIGSLLVALATGDDAVRAWLEAQDKRSL